LPLRGMARPATAGVASAESFQVGTWLSLVEHSLGVRGVGSSNLPVPTILLFSPFWKIMSRGSLFVCRIDACAVDAAVQKYFPGVSYKLVSYLDHETCQGQDLRIHVSVASPNSVGAHRKSFVERGSEVRDCQSFYCLGKNSGRGARDPTETIQS
jgi:hypothetical protein